MEHPMLGTTVKDKITGFKGVVSGVCIYLSGCNQALVVPSVGKDGSHREGHWIDIQRLERVGKDRITLDNGPTPGCDTPAPKR